MSWIKCSKEAHERCPDKDVCDILKNAIFLEGSPCHEHNLKVYADIEAQSYELKSCPFCGGAPEFVRKTIRTNGAWCDAVYVRCTSCDSRTGRVLYNAKHHPNGEEYKIAENSWNRRATNEAD